MVSKLHQCLGSVNERVFHGSNVKLNSTPNSKNSMAVLEFQSKSFYFVYPCIYKNNIWIVIQDC